MERSKTIINDLHGYCNKLTNSEPYTIRVDEKSEKGCPAVTLTAIRNPSFKLDTDIVLLAGEALYHLRSSLDHLVHQIVLLNEPSLDVQKEGRLQFPIFKTRSGYRSRSGRMIEGVSRLQASLIEREQPYERIPHAPHEDMLWVLRELHNTDKHRIIPATLILFNTLAARTGNKGTLFYVNGNTLLEEDEVVLGTYPVELTDEEIKANPRFSVGFEQFNFFSGVRWELVQLLWKTWRRVSEIINEFDSKVFSCGIHD